MRTGQDILKLLPRRERHDYLLIWGHGLKYKNQILELLRANKEFEILKIIRHKIADMVEFIEAVYSFDYAPIEHLKGKTKYLLDTTPEALLVFFKNLDAQESLVGEGLFRHIECRNIKILKEKIRDLYNPTIEGKRSENHVVHASDNELQTDIMLKYLGHERGVGMFVSANPVIDAPYHLAPFRTFEVRAVRLDQLVCNILSRHGGVVEPTTVGLEETPHHQALVHGSAAYVDYIEEFGGEALTDNHYWEKLLEMSNNVAYTAGEYATKYIIARECGDGRYLIVDGVHRASVLKSRGAEQVIIVVVGS